MLIVVVSVPVLLCVKPCVNGLCCRKSHSEEAAGEGDFVRVAEAEGDDAFNLRENIVKSNPSESGDHDGFGELMIHQMIETIEFVLGTISNTASYLRLWALSLAHSQLAKVFFDMTLNSGLASGSFLMLFLGFFVFIGATMGVLMMMDLLECCLHTLRLHWVEFQSKFFKGGGVAFTPVRMEEVLQARA